MENTVVLGHVVSTGADGWLPALEQSTDLFRAVVSDDISRLEAECDASPGLTSCAHKVLYWSADKKVEVRSRTLAMLATQHGSLRVLSLLLSKGANPQQMIDGLTCYEFIDSSNPNAPTIRAMLDDAAGNFAASGEAPGQAPGGNAPGSGLQGAHGSTTSLQQGYVQQELEADLEGQPYSTADLTRPEYSTDTFRMYCFKVLRCSKRYAHDWRACPFAHPTENARRRDPREFRYSSLVCPDYRQGCCVRGDTCQYAHGVFESWLHPSRYRTQLCKDQDKCDRPVCFFAHNITELRPPADSFVPNPDERLRVPQAMQVVLGMASPASLAAAAAPAGAADTGYAADQNPGELISPAQRQSASSSSIGTSGGGGMPCSSSSGGGSSSAASGGGGGLGSSAGGGSSSGGGGGSGDCMPGFGLEQAAAAAAAAAGSSPSPSKQLVSPGAVPVPRMSNAFARKHGLDPKDNPLVNLQRLAMQQAAPTAAAGTAGGRRQRRGRHQPPSPQPLLQPLPPLQPVAHQAHLMQPPPLSPAAYYGAQQAPQLQPGPQAPPPLLDPQAMALLFGGINLAAPPPLSPAAAAAAMASGGMGTGRPGVGAFPPSQLSPMSAYGMGPGMTGSVLGGGLGAAGLGPASPLGQPGLHPSRAGMHSPQPPPF